MDSVKSFLEVDTNNAAQLMDAGVLINLLLNTEHRVRSEYLVPKYNRCPVKKVRLIEKPCDPSEDHSLHDFTNVRRQGDEPEGPVGVSYRVGGEEQYGKVSCPREGFPYEGEEGFEDCVRKIAELSVSDAIVATEQKMCEARLR